MHPVDADLDHERSISGGKDDYKNASIAVP